MTGEDNVVAAAKRLFSGDVIVTFTDITAYKMCDSIKVARAFSKSIRVKIRTLNLIVLRIRLGAFNTLN